VCTERDWFDVAGVGEAGTSRKRMGVLSQYAAGGSDDAVLCAGGCNQRVCVSDPGLWVVAHAAQHSAGVADVGVVLGVVRGAAGAAGFDHVLAVDCDSAGGGEGVCGVLAVGEVRGVSHATVAALRRR